MGTEQDHTPQSEGDDHPIYHHGEILSAGSLTSAVDSGCLPLTVRCEVEVIFGPAGERLARAQTAALRDVLDYLAARNSIELPGKR